MKKNITVVSNMYPTEEHKSFGVFVKNQVLELRKHGLHVDVIAIDNPHKGKVNLLKKYGKWFLQFLFHFLIKGRKTDVVHAHYVFPSGLIGKWYKKFFGAKLVVTAHGGDIDKMAKKNVRIFNMTKAILEDADKVIAVGQDLYSTLKNDYKVSENKLSLINMGVNLEVFKKMDKIEARNACGIKPETTPILFVGNLIEQKGLLELVTALESINRKMNFDLYVIGSNKDSGFFDKLISEIKIKGLKDRIHFVGTKTQQEVAKWMAAAEIFVLPSHIEGFGLVALEAMACGTPVVGTSVGGLKYLLADQCGILAEPKNPVALEKALLTLLENEALKEEIIRNGSNRAVENDQTIMTERVIELYNQEGTKLGSE